jgi:NAD kinase
VAPRDARAAGNAAGAPAEAAVTPAAAAAGGRKLVLVTRRTRVEELVARHHTLAQARFYIEHLGADFGDYLKEHVAYQAARTQVLAVLARHERHQVVERGFLPNFLFGPADIVLALGQDGLVANTMKYLDGQPLVGINPEPHRYDGVLLPFEARDLAAVLPDILSDRRDHKAVTMAEAVLSDGQTLRAVNDLFIGPQSHTSARYEIALGETREVQSSSGVIVSTGLGSTGWMKSVVRGAIGVVEGLGHRHAGGDAAPLPWDAGALRFAVREPFPSRSSQAGLVYGEFALGKALELTSLMPDHGVIFSDGIEADYLAFNAGTRARIAVAARTGRLVI